MTTIAWRAHDRAHGRPAISADRLCSYHGMTFIKLNVLPDGSVVGCAGSAQAAAALVEWMAQGCVGPVPDLRLASDERVEYIRAYPDGTAVFARDYRLRPYPILDSYFAIGSGSDYAMGAMHQGADTKAAVEAAAAHDLNTSALVDTCAITGR